MELQAAKPGSRELNLWLFTSSLLLKPAQDVDAQDAAGGCC